MAGIIPIPTTRVADVFVRQRLAQQVQRDHLALFQIQNQISTGQRLQLPSDDAPGALRAINLQRLLDRKGQIQTNLQASNQFLAGADARLASVGAALTELRGSVVSVTGNVVSNEARQAVVQQIDSLLQELVNAGNAQMQGRYLFAGSRSQSRPYEYIDQVVKYHGNEGVLRSYVDLERLFETNLSGTEVFGGISAAVEGSVDLNPHLSTDTLLSTINGGSGIGSNPAVAISINSGLTETSVVDLSQAVTLGDVARLIEEGAPTADVTVEVTGTGLVLHTNSTSISVAEVAQGRTARLLGIISDPTVTINGTDLNPALLKTTRLANLLGTKAQGLIESTGNNNDILLTASANGTIFNGVTVNFVDDVAAGDETASYAPGVLTIHKAASSTASQVAAAITEEGTFIATMDYRDATSSTQAGTGIIDLGGLPSVAINNVTLGGSGQALDTTSGLILTNGSQSVTLDISGAETVEDFLNLINGEELGLLAEINASATGINVRSRLSGTDFTIGENGGTTATQLGIRTYTHSTELAAFNRGVGIPTNSNPAGDDFVITARDGTELSINLSGATTVQHVLDRINNHTSNTGLPQPITARLAATGNGIELVDATVGAGSLRVDVVEGSAAAEYLGFVPAGETEVSSTTGILQSEDRHTLETDSVFNTLLRLREALGTGNVEEIGRSVERLDVDISRITFARGEIGGRLQSLEAIDLRLEDENVQLRSALSQDLDVDLVEAISNLTARQFAFEASLRSAGSLMQLSLLDFI